MINATAEFDKSALCKPKMKTKVVYVCKKLNR